MPPTPTEEATRTPPAGLEGVWIAALGPVALEVADGQGRTTGRFPGEAQSSPPGIPGSTYERAPEAEFAFLGQGEAHTLRVRAESDGSVDLKVRVLVAGQIEHTAVYLGVRLGPLGHAELPIAPDAEQAKSVADWPALAVDADGDGIFEAQTPATALLDAGESADTSAPSLTIDPPVKTGGDVVTLSWSAADADAGLLLEQAILEPGTPSARVVRNGESLSLAPGPHQLLVLAQDRAGNTSVQELTVSASDPALP
jgi:hypothetical protein